MAQLELRPTSVSFIFDHNSSGGIFDGVPDTMFDPFEKIQAVQKNVANHPKVAPYLKDMKDEKMYGRPFAKLIGQ